MDFEEFSRNFRARVDQRMKEFEVEPEKARQRSTAARPLPENRRACPLLSAAAPRRAGTRDSAQLAQR
ncbi:hypothetical protein CATYP_02315 [Corynebacterium atypicum]|uniref:Uncharacterized protein n=1 Tax=Corynebacterium atypicum TaxID=191610 RepID=A0ABN4DBP0_9CORY|nr:hypothetical protein CATYP_02315 [Corynebacterium atypicum]